MTGGFSSSHRLGSHRRDSADSGEVAHTEDDIITQMIVEHRKIKLKEKEANLFLIDRTKKTTPDEHKTLCRFAAMLHRTTAKGMWKHDKIPDGILNKFRD